MRHRSGRDEIPAAFAWSPDLIRRKNDVVLSSILQVARWLIIGGLSALLDAIFAFGVLGPGLVTGAPRDLDRCSRIALFPACASLRGISEHCLLAAYFAAFSLLGLVLQPSPVNVILQPSN
jgi:hypothetical protein